jgi:hypothetical protein
MLPRNLASRRACISVRSLLSIVMLYVIVLSVAIPGTVAAENPLDAAIQHDFTFAAQQLNRTAGALSTTSYPSSTSSSGSWSTTGASSWTSGFFPGSLWLIYQRTADSAWKSKAQSWQAGIEGQKTRTDTHDLGFMIFNSFGNGYRLTGTEAYRQVVLTAASSLAKRYDPDVGCIRSWGSISDTTNFTVIVDNMINLELLFWASKHGGKAEWYDMAVSHALKTSANHVRADGSTYQIVTYSPTTGAVKSKSTKQGYNTESTWSRGQAWAVYGFTMTYRETGDMRFLETARKAADYFISHLPGDYVPYWDFELPDTTNQPKDSSAAAIAASGLIELSQLDPDPARKQTYLDAARAILGSLSSPAYLAEGTPVWSILLHGTQNKPDGKYDRGLIYGDYYFLEALLRYSAAAPAPDTMPPAVIARSPAAGATGVSVASNAIAAFDEAVTGVTASTFTLTPQGGTTAVAAAVTYDAATRTATLDPSADLTTDTMYTARLGSGISDLAGNSLAPLSWSFTTAAGSPPPPGSLIKAITFESGSLSGSNGADSVVGTVSLETAAPIKGTASARIPNTSSGYLKQGFAAVDTLYVSFYLKVHERPSSDTRIALISSSGTTIGNLLLRSTGTLRLRNGSTTIGAESAALAVGTVYRVGLRQQKGSGGNAVLEAYLATGDAAFGAPFAATFSGSWTSQASELRVGATNGNLTFVTVDDIKLDAGAMPTPSP